MAFHVRLFLSFIYIIIQSSSTELDFTTIKDVLEGRGQNGFSFVSSYFYNDGTLCNACSECSSSTKVDNLFISQGDDYCIKCEGDARCNSEEITAQVDMDFDSAWAISYHTIEASSSSNEHDPIEFSLFASNNTRDWDELSKLTIDDYPVGRNEARSYLLTNQILFQYYRIIFKKKKGVDSGNVPLRIGVYDISSVFTTQTTNDVMYELFKMESPISPTIDYGEGIKIGEIIKPRNEYSLTFSLNPSDVTLDYLSEVVLGSTLENASLLNGKTYGQYVLWMGIEKNGYQPIFKFSSTVNTNIAFTTLPSMLPNQKNSIKILCVGHKIIIIVNGVAESIDSALSTRPPLTKLNYFWIRSNESSQKARAVLTDLIFTSVKIKLPDPFMPEEQGICAMDDGSTTTGNKNRSYLGKASSKVGCLELCIRFYHDVTVGSAQDVSGCQYDPNGSDPNNCFIYDKANFIISKGSGGSNPGLCWPSREIIENAQDGACVKSDGSDDGSQTRIDLGKAQTINECRGFCLEYYYRQITQRQYFSGCEYETTTTNCFAYDDPKYAVTRGKADTNNNEQQCMPSIYKMFPSVHDGICTDVDGSTKKNLNRLTLKENESITKEACLALCVEAFYKSTDNGNISGCQYDNGQNCYLYHSPLFVAYQGDEKVPSICWTTAAELSDAPSLSPSELLTDETYFTTSSPPVESTRRDLAKKINLFDIQGHREFTSLFEEDIDDNDILDVFDDDDIENAINAAEDYYADLSDFVTQDISDPFTCNCVDCEEDEVCGGLWRGNRYENTANTDLEMRKIHVIVSHCKTPLDWIDRFLNGHVIASIHIITKCGEPVSKIGAPSMATIEVLPNFGRCDHTYAYYVTNVLPHIVKDKEDNSIVVFLKDDISINNLHQAGHWIDFEGLIRVASSDNGFACGITPDYVKFGQHQFLLSAYHEIEILSDFSMDDYQRNFKGYQQDVNEFMSIYDTVGDFWRFLNAEIPHKLAQVCYGGVFAASLSNIKRNGISTWKTLENSLSRGNNIQEGHYAERTWAILLSTPLQPYQVDALLYKSDGVYLNKDSMHGALMTRPQLFLHVGAYGTSSTELLAESLVEYESLLKLDGYNIAIYGKFDNGNHSFPNIDRLASCMWSNMAKSKIPENHKDETICPKKLLPELTDYMKRSQGESNDLVILNPWLARPGTAESLGIFIDPLWDVTTVVYYRRYFEWITIMFEHWREEFLDGLNFQDISVNGFRYIDFLRKYNKRLFYGRDAKEDPVRELHENTGNRHILNAKNTRRLKEQVDQFDSASNFDLKELTDHREYTYFVAKQYSSVPRLRHVTIVNSHDIRGQDVNFFCHVLDYTVNSCRAIIDKERLFNDTLEISNKDTMQHFNTTFPFKLETALEDIVIAAFVADKVQVNDIKMPKRKIEQIHRWIEMVRTSLHERNITVEDLPFECLSEFETIRLLQVSLAYEQSMLPMFFASPKGEKDLRDTFSQWKFCSVDTNEIIQGPQWNFLFESVLNFTFPKLPKAFVHIGAPKCGSTTLQDTMATDRIVLKEDKYFLALHGQVKSRSSDSHMIDNMLVGCDKLGACIWSDEERKIVLGGGGRGIAGVCPDFLLHEFSNFLTKAKAGKNNVVISNEWLNRRSSETGLLKILDGWDPEIVIYYRRFFDWIISAHYQWHFDIGTKTMETLNGKIRLVDFLRTFCAQLFGADSLSNNGLDLVDLANLQEYTYHIWKRYKKIPQYDNIKIVNFHSGNIVKSFYCDVLEAENACKLESERSETLKKRSKTSTIYFDLAVRNHWLGHAYKEDGSSHTKKEFQGEADVIKDRMSAMGFNEGDLPKECLTEAEKEKLLSVSLAYEKILLPKTYALGGAEKIKQQFAEFSMNNLFCSVDLNILDDPKFAFLFH